MALKVVIAVEEDIVTIITAYPLKKGKQNENILR